MDSYAFVHCINPNCKSKLSNSDWNSYFIPKINKYKCPYCGVEWEPKDQAFNAFDITDSIMSEEDIENLLLLVVNGKKIDVEMKVSMYGIKTDSNRVMMNVSTKFIKEDTRIFIIEENKLADFEILLESGDL